MISRLLVFLLAAGHVCAAGQLFVCGADEVFRIDPATKSPEKLWSWRARDRAEIPEALKKAFATMDECKPLEGGKRLLVSSSSGGCALLELPAGKALWWARVPNAHTIEPIPGGRVAVASSVGAQGNKVLFFNIAQVGPPIAEIPLPSAHGLVWDEKRDCLWALGFEELVVCKLVEKDGTLMPEITARFPLPDKDGHDLRPLPESADLILSTHKGVWRFHRDTKEFRPDPDLKGRPMVKCIDALQQDGRKVVVQAGDGHWWTDSLQFLNPPGTMKLNGEHVYKARWVEIAD